MSKTWVVVAESSRAKVFELEEQGKGLREVENLTHPASRQHEQEMTSSLPGRSFDSLGGQRHVMEEPTSPKHQEAIVFSKQIAARLEAARSAGEFDKLVLMAAPAFLGLLREALSAPTAKLVAAEVHKNLVLHDTNDIRAHVPAHL